MKRTPEQAAVERAADAIVQAVAASYGVGAGYIMGRSRVREINDARQTAMALLHVYLPMSTKALGRYFDRDHTTICHGASEFLDRAAAYPDIERRARELETVADYHAGRLAALLARARCATPSPGTLRHLTPALDTREARGLRMSEAA